MKIESIGTNGVDKPLSPGADRLKNLLGSKMGRMFDINAVDISLQPLVKMINDLGT